MEGVEKEENHANNNYPHFHLYVPGKLKTNPPNGRFNSTILSEKNTSDLTSCNSGNDRLSRPINLFSSEFRKIDTDLKKMHRIWSNID
jgi:hypothetical protein